MDIKGADDSGTDHILDNVRTHEAKASQHRLNQLEPKGPQKKRLENLKEKEIALKQQRKAEMFTIEAFLVLYPTGGATHRRVWVTTHYLFWVSTNLQSIDSDVTSIGEG